MTKYIGQRTKITTEEIKERYITLGKNNEKAAKVLEQQGLYNEAVFMYIQAMEKKIKGYICGKINSENPYFARKIREMGHSLDSSVDFLIEILSGNDENLKAQLSKLLRDAYSARTAHPFQRNGAPFRFKLSKAQQVY